MKVLHTYCLNYNVGDYALGFGVKNVLRHAFDIEQIGQTNLQGRQFNEYYINEVVNKLYDMLVIGGGGVIHGAHWPQGWFWLIEKELIRTIKIPFIVYAVGYNYFESEGSIPERGIDHLHETYRHAAHFSVRNDGSHGRLLDATGIDAQVLPDPGFHVGLGREWGEVVEDDFVVVQIADDKSSLRYGDETARAKFIENMRVITGEIAQTQRVIFIPHVLHDVAISKEISDGIVGAEVLDFGSYAFDQCESVMKYYRDARYVLSVRGHGQIVPIGFGTPVVSLGAHAKMGGMMRSLGLEEYHVEVHSPTMLNEVRTVIKRIEDDYPQLQSRLASIGEGFTGQTLGALASLSELMMRRPNPA